MGLMMCWRKWVSQKREGGWNTAISSLHAQTSGQSPHQTLLIPLHVDVIRNFVIDPKNKGRVLIGKMDESPGEAAPFMHIPMATTMVQAWQIRYQDAPNKLCSRYDQALPPGK